MIRFVTIIGARPQFIKAAAISRAFAKLFPSSAKEIIVHTGQHYDPEMSQVFFDEMKIPRPDYMLDAGSSSHGRQTGFMIAGIEEILESEKPHCVILYGDTNSTLAGAIAASKLYLNIAHVEAGLRSFNKKMPEEINRIMCDHVSSFLFCPTPAAVANLEREGFSTAKPGPYNMDNPKVYSCGDVMYDNTLFFAEYAARNSTALESRKTEKGKYILATIHRNTNTDDPQRLGAIFKALLKIIESSGLDIILPLHPRTKKMMESFPDESLRERISGEPRLKVGAPASFIEMTQLEANCAMVITDSGGVQKEAYFLHKPCIVLRTETEWVELLSSGNCVLADADADKIFHAFNQMVVRKDSAYPPIFGDGKAAEFIVTELMKELGA